MRRLAFALVLPAVLATTACQSGARTSRTGTAPAGRSSTGPSSTGPSSAGPSSAGPSSAGPAYAGPSAPSAARPAPAYSAPPAAVSAPAGAPRYDATNPSMDQALAGARAAGKPLAVFLLAGWCGFCRKLDAGALQDASVHAEMANFYAVRVDPDTATGRQFARLARGGYPTVAILDATGAEKANWAGNRPAPDLAAKLRSAR